MGKIPRLYTLTVCFSYSKKRCSSKENKIEENVWTKERE